MGNEREIQDDTALKVKTNWWFRPDPRRLREENEELRSKGAAVAENIVGKGCAWHGLPETDSRVVIICQLILLELLELKY